MNSSYLTFCWASYVNKIVLFGIQGYWSSYLFLLKGILKKIQSYVSRFLWGGKYDASCHHKVSWLDFCLIIADGGLGIRDMVEWNRAAIFLQIWRVTLPTSNSLWILQLARCLFKRKLFWTTSIPSSSPSNVEKMFKLRMEACRFMTLRWIYTLVGFSGMILGFLPLY